ncbi:MAG TPA: imidazole glycerol phosphate synthase subunit HisH [Myxococcota bacterium]|jgi:glutamine amidotransferase|nr:imidazole glycerol phosphate synthase subunit HisH [Myxococcota bacterium]
MSSAPVVALVDYGAGNVRSVAKALERSGLVVRLTGDPAEVLRADGVVLPGAGAFRDAAVSLAAKGLPDAVRESIASGRPYLGLCVGMQLLFEEGHEHGTTKGFGLLRGRVARFSEVDAAGRPRRVPHIGWNEVRFRGRHPMLERLPGADHFYFVHSYRPEGVEPSCVVGTTDYGGEFVSAVATERIFAVQFHPEKSQAAGKRLLDAYAAWVAACR